MKQRIFYVAVGPKFIKKEVQNRAGSTFPFQRYSGQSRGSAPRQNHAGNQLESYMNVFRNDTKATAIIFVNDVPLKIYWRMVTLIKKDFFYDGSV